ncbi:MAG: hypothetical protein RLY16_2043 [Bacteroidota bacterium]|jgi:glycosyltransferase involved in cell wall biosynthesis
MKKLAILSTHPIQYNAPLFALLAKSSQLQIMVFYTWGKAVLNNKYDPGFKKVIEWDIPLLDGYPSSFVENVSSDPGSHHYGGIDNPDLIQQIEAFQADALLVFGWNLKSHLKCLRYFHKRITVLFCGDSTLIDDQDHFIKKILRQLVLRYVYHHVDIGLYTGAASKDYFLHYGFKETELFMTPHAIDNKRFGICTPEMEANIAEFKYQLGIQSGELTVLFAGKLEPKKNPTAIIEVAKLMQHHPVHFIVVGNGEQEQSLKSAASSFSNIHFVDFQNQQKMPEVYRWADVFILPSRGPGETWGLALNEAMATGRVVIASNKCGGARDLINPDENGWIVAPDDYQAVANKLTLLIQEPALLKRMQQASLTQVQKFSFEAMAEAIHQALQIPAHAIH